MLALLAVVVVGVSLGSALHSTGTPQRTSYTTQVFDTPGAVCGNVKAELRSTSPALRPYLRRELRRICRKHR